MPSASVTDQENVNIKLTSNCEQKTSREQFYQSAILLRLLSVDHILLILNVKVWMFGSLNVCWPDSRKTAERVWTKFSMKLAYTRINI